MGERVGLRVGSVVIDCNEFDAMVTFWQNVLGYQPKSFEPDDWALLRDPTGRNVNVSLQKVPEPRVGKNRLHFDLYAEDQQGESSG